MNKTAEPARSLFLGVDGGGSKTLAVLVDARGIERGRGLAGSSNHRVVGMEGAVASILAAVHAAHRAARCDGPVAVAWIGLAGVDDPNDVALLAPELGSLASAVRLTNDAELALSGLAERAGVALIAGTGSIVIGRNAAGRIGRAGGWGHLLGDEGSGYDIGLRALRAAVRSVDGRGQPTLLLPRILDAWGLQAPHNLYDAVYERQDKARIARLANLVIAAAGDGDEVSRHIVRVAAEELALAVEAVVHALELPLPVALALGGGLLVHEDAFRTMTLDRINRALSVASVTIVEEPALSAARSLAVTTI